MLSRNITLPLPLVLAGLATLSISLLSHTTSFYFNTRVEIQGAQVVPVTTPTFPIPIRAASLTTSKSERFGLYANASDWDSILPPGDGFLVHPSDGQHYLVAHYHSIHCLRSMRRYLRLAMVPGAASSNTEHNSDTEERSTAYKFNDMDRGHVDHCLIYLRQLTLCNADLALEPASHRQMTPSGKVADTVTGVGVTHQCKDWAQVWDYMEENYNVYKDSY